MYAIVAHGNQQYRVEKGQVLEIDLVDADPGSEYKFDRVLAVSDDSGFRLGKPTVGETVVTARVLGEVQGEKLYVQKFRRRKTYRRRTGHRQSYLKVQILDIVG